MDLIKWQQKLSPLKEVKMPEEFQAKMMKTLELEQSNGQPAESIAKVPVFHRRIWLGSSAAGIACTAVIAGGLFLLNNSNHSYKMMPTSPAPVASNSTNTAMTNGTVAMNPSSEPSTPGTGNQQVQSSSTAETGTNAPVQTSKPSISPVAGETRTPQTVAGGTPSTSAGETTNSTALADTTNSANSLNTGTAASEQPASDKSTSSTNSSVSSSTPSFRHHTVAEAQPSDTVSNTGTTAAANVPMIEGALALFPPQITGTIVAIAPGNPSSATLKDAEEVAVPNGPRIHHDLMTIQLPSGGWVGSDHWQSVGNTLDLFIGEQILDLNHEKTISGISSHNYQGLIKSVQDNQMVVQLVEFAGTNAKGQPSEVLTNQLVTLNLKPYTTISWQGGEQVSVSALKPNEPVLIVDEGISSYEIARQITVFPDADAAGWQLTN